VRGSQAPPFSRNPFAAKFGDAFKDGGHFPLDSHLCCLPDPRSGVSPSE
jgi:hypothetical protein